MSDADGTTPALSPFGVTLHRLGDGEAAIPPPPKNKGQRTKFGGTPDWIQQDQTPLCDRCGRAMSFVAQIDSLDHIAMNNPFGFDRKPEGMARWMFGDVGMIYVFVCFDCSDCKSLMQCY